MRSCCPFLRALRSIASCSGRVYDGCCRPKAHPSAGARAWPLEWRGRGHARSDIRPAGANNLGSGTVPSEAGFRHPSAEQEKMLLILIPVAWLALVTLLVALCRMAAWGDRAALGRTSLPANDPGRAIVAGQRAWTDLDELVYGQRIPRRSVGAPASVVAQQPSASAQRLGTAFTQRLQLGIAHR